MITVKEAIKLLEENEFQAGIINCDYDVIEENTTKAIKLLEHLESENSLLKTILSEIKKHQTACNALKFALARVKELEDIDQVAKDKARDVWKTLDDNPELAEIWKKITEAENVLVSAKANFEKLMGEYDR